MHQQAKHRKLLSFQNEKTSFLALLLQYFDRELANDNLTEGHERCTIRTLQAKANKTVTCLLSGGAAALVLLHKADCELSKLVTRPSTPVLLDVDTAEGPVQQTLETADQRILRIISECNTEKEKEEAAELAIAKRARKDSSGYSYSREQYQSPCPYPDIHEHEVAHYFNTIVAVA